MGYRELDNTSRCFICTHSCQPLTLWTLACTRCRSIACPNCKVEIDGSTICFACVIGTELGIFKLWKNSEYIEKFESPKIVAPYIFGNCEKAWLDIKERAQWLDEWEKHKDWEKKYDKGELDSPGTGSNWTRN